MNYLLIPVLFGIWAAYVTYVFLEKDESFLKKRITSAGKKYKTDTKKIFDSILSLVKPLTAGNIKNAQFKNKIKNLLIRVGAPSSEDDVLDFENRRLVVVLVVSLFAVIIVTIFKFNYIVAVACWFLVCIIYEYPALKLKKLIKKREKEFEKNFPDAIDLLSVCVEAGLGLDSAIERVGKEFQSFSPTVGYEFLRLAQDTTSGLTRQEALKNMTKRIKCKDLQSFVALLIQSEKLGTGIAQSLALYCDTLRSRKKQKIEELVQSASAKMTIPMVLFLLPSMFVVILYPAIIKVIEALKASNF